MKTNMVIGLDFDGTVVKHNYPDIGEPVPNALECLREYINCGYKIVLNTMRSGKELTQAILYLEANGIKLYGVNSNPTQINWTESPKVYANFYIDDAAIGCPLLYPVNGRPYVDWVEVDKILRDRYEREQ